MTMTIGTIITFLGFLLAVVSSTIAAVLFIVTKKFKTDQLSLEIMQLRKDYEEQLAVKTTEITKLKRRCDIISGNLDSNIDTFDELYSLSSEVAMTISAEMHSISTAKPFGNPTHLSFILSTDKKASSILGHEFPIRGSIAGWVFENQKLYIQNDVAKDKRHYSKVSKAVDSPVKAMMTLPLTHNNIKVGVIQFIKQLTEGRGFTEDDAEIVSKVLSRISGLTYELQINKRKEIPQIIRENTINCSVLFTDIQGFSSVASEVTLGVSVSLLNEYYRRLIPSAIQNNGKLEEYVGDGLYFSFRTDSHSSNVRLAIQAAIGMQEEYKNLITSWKEWGHPVSDKNQHGIGISTGKLNYSIMGMEDERRFKLVGSAVNNAAHLCKKAKKHGNSILICSNTYNFISSEFKVLPINSEKNIFEVCRE